MIIYDFIISTMLVHVDNGSLPKCMITANGRLPMYIRKIFSKFVDHLF